MVYNFFLYNYILNLKIKWNNFNLLIMKSNKNKWILFYFYVKFAKIYYLIIVKFNFINLLDYVIESGNQEISNHKKFSAVYLIIYFFFILITGEIILLIVMIHQLIA